MSGGQTERKRERGGSVILLYDFIILYDFILRTCEEFHVNGIFPFEIFSVQTYQGVKNKCTYSGYVNCNVIL